MCAPGVSSACTLTGVRLSDDHPTAAARLVWGRYFQELLVLARNHLSARIRCREDEEDVLRSMYKSFCSRQRRGDFDLANRDELWNLLVRITLRKARNAANRHLQGKPPRALADDVEHWLADEPVSAWHEPVRRRMRRWGRRHRLLVTSFGATKARSNKPRQSGTRWHVSTPRHSLARMQLGLGDTLTAMKKFSRAEVALKESTAVMEKLAAAHPLNTRFTSGLADSYQEMQDCYLLQGDLESAVIWSGSAVKLNRSLVRQDPDDHQAARTGLWTCLAGRAETLTRLGRQAEAIADFEEVPDITQSIDSGKLFQAFLALARARVGDLSMHARLGQPIRDVFKL